MTAYRRRGTDRTVHACFSVREAPGITVAVSHDGTGLVTTVRHTAQRALTEAGRGYLGGRVELRTPRPPARVTSRPSAFGTRRRRAVRRAADRAVALAVAATLRGDAADVRVPVRPPL
ncbi:hypothetical protein GCM10010222_20160 [Streptomyces tanashiensis]|uniref:hypothetical protein n=1 Tax=Streptomyces tanashiensis TaxID=67367 RepID=UPI0016738409|nr:hypothetical protein [Streptomyces tanashiensis]GGS78693.1 hypothetical protein GCM10010222_20160 [Streptomyces tanashiensis]